MSKSQKIENCPIKAKKDYSENIWTNNDGKIDGYTFKGKRVFGKALVGLKSIMVKGKQNEIGNVEFTALDTRKQGVGFEIDVEIISNKNRGVAVLKIYGPKDDIKKDNTVTVSKSKGSDSKFVILLAEKVVMPLMDRFLSGELGIPALSLDTNTEESGTEPKQFKCSFCEKICKSAKGLKTHTTKMHIEIQKEDIRIEQKKRKATEEVNGVVESLLANVVDKSEDKITIEEIIEIGKDSKKYTKICNICNFQVEADKKYISLQKIRQHKDMCYPRMICPQCDKRFYDNTSLKRHMRNEHSMISSSTSPPLKKKRVDSTLISSLNDSIELMDTDSNVDQEETLSKMMDEKVIAKQRKNDDEVEAFLQKKIEIKLKEEESIKERNKRQQAKLKKQKNKKHSETKQKQNSQYQKYS